jgi:cytochrome b561
MTSPSGYTRLQIVLHWFAALLILQQYVFKDAIAAAWDAMAKGLEPAFNPMVLGHVASGGLILIFALWRLLLRARVGGPELPGGSALQNGLARGTHLGLYAAMVLMPLSGLAAWFGSVQLAAQGHAVLKFVLVALVLLHVSGALYHHFVLKDGLIDRMRRARS